MKHLTWGAGLALFGAALALAAAPPDNPPKTDNPPTTVSDADFARMATAAQLAEINFGRLAADQASSPDVKQFGQHMVDDHTKGLEEVNKAADKAGLATAQTMGAKDKDMFTKLSSMKGADFDKEYITSQVAAHKDAVALFQAESKNGKNDDLKAVADKLLPTLQHHLEMAQKLAGSDTGTKPDKTSTDSKDKPIKDK